MNEDLSQYLTRQPRRQPKPQQPQQALPPVEDIRQTEAEFQAYFTRKPRV